MNQRNLGCRDPARPVTTTREASIYMTTELALDLEERFLRYVQIDTEADETSASVPSTQKQLVLLEILATELREMGAADVCLTDYATVLATVPATDPNPDIPSIAFLSHVDTTPAFSGKDVKPRVHRQWDGSPVSFPDDAALVLDTAQCPDLAQKIGHDLITGSGASLLGADDKAGVAIVMSMARHLLQHPEIPHGRIRLCFTPDEEIGRGVAHLTPEDLDAQWAYTLDGGDVGELSSETFAADKAVVRFQGVSIHPGTAFHAMVNAATMATQFMGLLPAHARTPETTKGREGFIHLYQMQGTAAEAELHFILRDFAEEILQEHGRILTRLAETMQLAEPRARISCEIVPQYRNMRRWLEQDMTPVNMARQAMRDVGIEPVDEPIRGGTDGSMLTAKGVPTPNLFTGMHEVHGPLEWVTVQDMALATKVCLQLSQNYAASA